MASRELKCGENRSKSLLWAEIVGREFCFYCAAVGYSVSGFLNGLNLRIIVLYGTIWVTLQLPSFPHFRWWEGHAWERHSCTHLIIEGTFLEKKEVPVCKGEEERPKHTKPCFSRCPDNYPGEQYICALKPCFLWIYHCDLVALITAVTFSFKAITAKPRTGELEQITNF